jgi:hypothetical protein
MELSEDELAVLIDERVQNAEHMRGEAYSQLSACTSRSARP